MCEKIHIYFGVRILHSLAVTVLDSALGDRWLHHTTCDVAIYKGVIYTHTSFSLLYLFAFVIN